MPEASLNRVAVFIDNSNVFNRIKEWNNPAVDSFYDPLFLAQKVTGGRKLVYTGFYCSPPPAFLASGSESEQRIYAKQMQYLSEVAKMPGISIKYGSVNGFRGSLQEKNLDTQLVADMVAMAAKNMFDVAVLVSNDGDYVSAINPVRDDFAKRVEVIYFRKKMSMHLKQSCDLARRARPIFFRRLPTLSPAGNQGAFEI